MRIILLLFLRVIPIFGDKLDRTYLPPPGSVFSGGRYDDLQTPFIKPPPGITSSPNYGSGVKNEETYQRPETEQQKGRDRDYLNVPQNQYDTSKGKNNVTGQNQPGYQIQQTLNTNSFSPSASVTGSTTITEKPYYSRFGPDSFANQDFRPGSYNPEGTQPNRFSSNSNQTYDNRQINPQTSDVYSDQENISKPGQKIDDRQFNPQTGEGYIDQENDRKPGKTITDSRPNIVYETQGKYQTINKLPSKVQTKPGQINKYSSEQPQDNLNRSSQPDQSKTSNVPYYKENEYPATLPSSTFSRDSPKETNILPSSKNYRPNYQNDTRHVYPENTPSSSLISYPDSVRDRFPGVYKKTERPQSALERNSVILDYKNILTPEGFEYSFDTSNGIHADENGTAIDGVKAQGSFSYTGDDGKFYEVVYSADENGFQPSGDHLPTPPPIPKAIQRVIEEAERNRDAGVTHDGFYDDKKYGHKKYDKTQNRYKSKRPHSGARPESDQYNRYDDINDKQDFQNKKPNLKKEYYHDTNDEENLPESGYQTDRQFERPETSYKEDSDDDQRHGGNEDRIPIHRNDLIKNPVNKSSQTYKKQERKPSSISSNDIIETPNKYKNSQKQPERIVNKQAIQNIPVSNEQGMSNGDDNRYDDRDETLYTGEDSSNIFDSQDEEGKSNKNYKRPVIINKLDKPSQRKTLNRPKVQKGEINRITTKTPQNNNIINFTSENKYQNQRPQYNVGSVSKQDDVNFDEGFDLIETKPSIDEKDQQDYNFIKPDRTSYDNFGKAKDYSTSKQIGSGRVPLPPSRFNKTKQEGYEYLPPSKLFDYETTTLSTRKSMFQTGKPASDTNNGVNLDLEAPFTTPRPYTRYSTFKPNQNRPLFTVTDQPDTMSTFSGTFMDKTPFVQGTNRRTTNISGQGITSKPIETFFESSTIPDKNKKRPIPKNETYQYITDTDNDDTTTPTLTVIYKTQIDESYPFRQQSVKNKYPFQQQNTDIVKPGYTYNIKDKRPTRPQDFESPKKYAEPERDSNERPESNQYDNYTEYQQSTTPDFKRPSHNRLEYISGVTRLPDKTPTYVPQQRDRIKNTKTSSISYPRYQTGRPDSVPVTVIEDSDNIDKYPKYKPVFNQSSKMYPYYSENTKYVYREGVKRPVSRPSDAYPSKISSKQTDTSQVVPQRSQTTIHPEYQTDYTDNKRMRNQPSSQPSDKYPSDFRPKQTSAITKSSRPTPSYSESQNIDYSDAKKDLNIQNQPFSRPSNAYPGFETKQSQIQGIPRNVTQVITTDRARPGIVSSNYPNERQDSNVEDRNKSQSVLTKEYYENLEPQDDKYDDSRRLGTAFNQNRPRIPGFQDTQGKPERKTEKQPSIGDKFYTSNVEQERFSGQNFDNRPNYPNSSPEIIGEDFSGPKQPQKYDPVTGYHY